MGQKYLPRIADNILSSALEAFGAVLIEGPKWCGKTWTAKERAASTLFMQDPDNAESYALAADTKPSVLLKGKTPRLIDEWQAATVLWDSVRHAVDQRGEVGQFILTGSAVPPDDVVKHTGIGRISRMNMRPMTLFESMESNGSVSLRSLFDNSDIEGISELTIERLAFALARGGWPASIGKKDALALDYAYDYVNSVTKIDISRIDKIEKDPARVEALFRSLARNVSTAANMKTIKGDVDIEGSLSEKTISLYLNALRRLYVVEDLPAWSPSMRSKATLRTSPKRHFVDPSIAVAALKASPDSLLNDFKTFGLLFESLCVRDLRVYSQAMSGSVFYYRDNAGLEVDVIIQLRNGRWGAVEVKMGNKEIEDAAEKLKAFKEKIDPSKMAELSFLMVLTAGKYAYRRADGIYIVPVGCLKD
jgi:predicted AAA+ superfamily ATPase